MAIKLENTILDQEIELDAEQYVKKTLENRRKFIKDAMKDAEKAADELEKATATEKVRLQGTKEPKVPNLKPYTETKHVKGRSELATLITEARKAGNSWKVGRCNEELAKQGYRYTFTETKYGKKLNHLKEDIEIGPDIPLELDAEAAALAGDGDLPPVGTDIEYSEDELEKVEVRPEEVISKYFVLSGDEEKHTISICKAKCEEGEECPCIEVEVSEEDFEALRPMFNATEEKEEEPEDKDEGDKGEEDKEPEEIEEDLNESWITVPEDNKEELYDAYVIIDSNGLMAPKVVDIKEMKIDQRSLDDQILLYRDKPIIYGEKWIDGELHKVSEIRVVEKKRKFEDLNEDFEDAIVSFAADTEEEVKDFVDKYVIPEEERDIFLPHFYKMKDGKHAVNVFVGDLKTDTFVEAVKKAALSLGVEQKVADRIEKEAADYVRDVRRWDSKKVNESLLKESPILWSILTANLPTKEAAEEFSVNCIKPKEEREYSNTDDIEYPHIREEKDGSFNVTFWVWDVKEDKWDEVNKWKEVFIDKLHKGVFDKDKPEITEASSAEKRAFKHGGRHLDNYIRGKALARVKDKDERDMLIAQNRMSANGRKMSDRPEVDKTLDRKMAQASANYEKKASSMAKAGLQEKEQQLNEDAIIKLDDIKFFKPWGGAKETFDAIEKAEKFEDLDFALVDMYPEGLTATELNDLLWFEQDWVLDTLGIDLSILKIDDAGAIDAEAEITEVEPEDEE